MNILIASSYSKSETEECLKEFIAGFDSSHFVGELYSPVLDLFSIDPNSEVRIYDVPQDEVVIDEVVIFSTPELVESVKLAYKKYPVVSVSGIRPAAWKNPEIGYIKNLRDERLESFYYAPKNAYFQCNPKSMILISGRALKLTRMQLRGEDPGIQEWRTTDNQMVHFTVDEFLDFAEAAEPYVEQVYRDSWGLMGALSDSNQKSTNSFEDMFNA